MKHVCKLLEKVLLAGVSSALGMVIGAVGIMWMQSDIKDRKKKGEDSDE